jgi:predicted  nucleic acid-binding Zn-ribbon protein
MKIEVSNGEIIDKLTILEIKLDKIADKAKRANIKKDYDQLNKAAEAILDKNDTLYIKLKEVNNKLWEIEDRIRDFERKQEFGRPFIETARMVYFSNDLRAKIKHDINLKTGSDLVEEKSYEDY